MRLLAWFRRSTEPVIKPPRYVFTGFDQTLRDRTAARRKQAAEIREDAARFETRPDMRSRLKVVR